MKKTFGLQKVVISVAENTFQLLCAKSMAGMSFNEQLGSGLMVGPQSRELDFYKYLYYYLVLTTTIILTRFKWIDTVVHIKFLSSVLFANCFTENGILMYKVHWLFLYGSRFSCHRSRNSLNVYEILYICPRLLYC